MQGNGKNDPKKSSPEVCVVIDVISSPPGHIDGVGEKETGIDNGGYGDDKDP